MPRARHSGFTLIELLLVVTIIGAIVAFAWPDFQAASDHRRLIESAERTRTLVSMCRAEAMNESRRYRIEFRVDGSVRTRVQLDPIHAPHLYNPVDAPWGRTQVLLTDVWVEALEVLPEGPAPIRIIDEELELTESEIDLLPIDEYENDVVVDIEPDGACPSLRWVLRDAAGRALLVTLDGRLGRVSIEPWETLERDEVIRPEPLPDDEEEEIHDLEDYRE